MNIKETIKHLIFDALKNCAQEGQHTTLYATSRDGVSWEKPMDLDIVKYNGSNKNNILIANCTPENVLKIDYFLQRPVLVM